MAAPRYRVHGADEREFIQERTRLRGVMSASGIPVMHIKSFGAAEFVRVSGWIAEARPGIAYGGGFPVYLKGVIRVIAHEPNDWSGVDGVQLLYDLIVEQKFVFASHLYWFLVFHGLTVPQRSALGVALKMIAPSAAGDISLGPPEGVVDVGFGTSLEYYIYNEMIGFGYPFMSEGTPNYAMMWDKVLVMWPGNEMADWMWMNGIVWQAKEPDVTNTVLLINDYRGHVFCGQHGRVILTDPGMTAELMASLQTTYEMYVSRKKDAALRFVKEMPESGYLWYFLLRATAVETVDVPYTDAATGEVRTVVCNVREMATGRVDALYSVSGQGSLKWTPWVHAHGHRMAKVSPLNTHVPFAQRVITTTSERLRTVIGIYLASRHRLGMVPNGEGTTPGPTGGMTFPEMEEEMFKTFLGKDDMHQYTY